MCSLTFMWIPLARKTIQRSLYIHFTYIHLIYAGIWTKIRSMNSTNTRVCVCAEMQLDAQVHRGHLTSAINQKYTIIILIKHWTFYWFRFTSNSYQKSFFFVAQFVCHFSNKRPIEIGVGRQNASFAFWKISLAAKLQLIFRTPMFMQPISLVRIREEKKCIDFRKIIDEMH